MSGHLPKRRTGKGGEAAPAASDERGSGTHGSRGPGGGASSEATGWNRALGDEEKARVVAALRRAKARDDGTEGEDGAGPAESAARGAGRGTAAEPLARLTARAHPGDRIRDSGNTGPHEDERRSAGADRTGAAIPAGAPRRESALGDGGVVRLGRLVGVPTAGAEGTHGRARRRRRRTVVVVAAAGVAVLAAVPVLLMNRGDDGARSVVSPTATDVVVPSGVTSVGSSHRARYAGVGRPRPAPTPDASATPGTTATPGGGHAPAEPPGHASSQPGRPATSAPESPAATRAPQQGNALIVNSTRAIDSGDPITNGSTALSMTADGDLEVTVGGVVRWHSGTTGAGDKAVFQDDGNFVVYDEGMTKPLWSADTAGHPDAVLVLEADGNVDIRDGGDVIWSADTGS